MSNEPVLGEEELFVGKKISIYMIIPALLFLAGCGEKIQPGEHAVERPEVSGVRVEQINPVEVTDYYETSGTVRARNTAFVSAKIMGEVKELKVRAGDKVQKGDLLLSIHSPDIGARVRAAEEAVGEASNGLKIAEENKTLAGKTFERYKMLYDAKALTQQEFDEIRSKREIALLQYEMSRKSRKRAEAALHEAEAFGEYSLIRSPVRGVIAEKKIDVGTMTVPGMPLLIIEESAYRVEALVGEEVLQSIKDGSRALIFIDALNMNTAGVVGELDHSIDPLTRTFRVKIDIKDTTHSLRGGLYARVKFPLGSRSALYVNERAVVTRGEIKGVYTVNRDGIITLRLVKTGKKRDGMVEVLSGLSSGERIIIEGVEKALDGGKIAHDG